MQSGASKTALMVAAYRGRATALGMIDEPWAAALAGDDGARLAEAYDRVVPHMDLWMATRTWFLDQQVREHVTGRSCAQVVLLGAGLDTRAARLGAPGARF